VLRRDDIGAVAAGKAADFVAFRVDDLGHAGALADPVTALVTCTPVQVWASVINGRVVVEDGQFLPFELPPVIERHNQISQKMMAKAGVL
jgi:cytosine/adenosine deaminase-related metal-dependent hydrolase